MASEGADKTPPYPVQVLPLHAWQSCSPRRSLLDGSAPSRARKMRVPGRADSTVLGLRSSWSGWSSRTPLAFKVVAMVARPNRTLSPICRPDLNAVES